MSLFNIFLRFNSVQFLPGDPEKVLITSADSQVRIIQGHDVICRYRGKSLLPLVYSYVRST